MKKIVLLLITFSLSGCGSTNERATSPSNENIRITKSDWNLAFGEEKPFYISDNYTLVATQSLDSAVAIDTFYVDGLKVKEVANMGLKNGEFYYCKENDKFFEYLFTTTWTKSEIGYNPLEQMFQTFIPIYKNYDAFQYNETKKTYDCSSIVINQNEYINLVVSFKDSKIETCDYDIKRMISQTEYKLMHVSAVFTYNTATVSLPEVE